MVRGRPITRRGAILCRIALALAAAAAAVAGGCDVGLPPDVAARKFVQRDLKFALDVPHGWSTRESAGPVAFFATAPEADGGVTATVTVAVEPEPPGMMGSVTAVAIVYRRDLEALPGLKVFDDAPRRMSDGRDAWVMTLEHAALGRPVRQRQLTLLAHGQAYTVTVTASPEAWERREAELESVLGSFRAGW